MITLLFKRQRKDAVITKPAMAEITINSAMCHVVFRDYGHKQPDVLRFKISRLSAYLHFLAERGLVQIL